MKGFLKTYGEKTNGQSWRLIETMWDYYFQDFGFEFILKTCPDNFLSPISFFFGRMKMTHSSETIK